jgi:hypothetical protein
MNWPIFVFVVVVMACQLPIAYVVGYRRGFKRGGDERHRLLNQLRRDGLR